MRTRPMRRTSRAARLARGLWPDRNPLRRSSDRAEAGLLAAKDAHPWSCSAATLSLGACRAGGCSAHKPGIQDSVCGCTPLPKASPLRDQRGAARREADLAGHSTACQTAPPPRSTASQWRNAGTGVAGLGASRPICGSFGWAVPGGG